ncbi:ABC transporter substrate-binding protein [Desulfobulbus elongatus]|uniref:ABC transporter substrate-binding protein n=1 Tax=Desulfobulbus elongatus TaxID=53332 RepID=UPI00047FE03C|nr:ABC transporter substrate binding protein [Desulfobulbus elongatus]
MHRAGSWRICFVFFLPLLMAVGPPASTGPATVLVVHSYHRDQREHVAEMDKGIEEALVGVDCRRRFFYMDTKRQTSEAWKQAAGEQARRIVAEERPRVVIAMDDNAQQYFARHYAGAAGPPWFVFGGVNADPARYGFPAANVTGVLERPNVSESIELLLRIRPGASRLLVMADKSETTDPLIAFCKTLTLPVAVVAYEQPLTLEDWQAAIERHRGRVDAVLLYVIRTIVRSAADPTKVPERELVRLLNDGLALPTVGLYDSAAESGVLCGLSVSMREQGRATGQIARALLAGGTPADFPIAPTDRGRIQLNLRTAERLGIQIPYTVIKRAEVVIR